MCSERDVLALVSAIYDAAANPCLWPDYLERLSAQMGGTSALLLRHGALYPSGSVLAAAGIEDSFQRSYAEYFGSRNVWLGQVPRAIQDSARTSQMMMPVAELMKSEFYQSFLRPQNVLHSVAACIRADPRSTPLCIVFRSPRERPFSTPHMKLLTLLTPHMRRALELQERTAGFQVQRSAALAGLDALPLGCLLVDGQARVLMANRSAEAMLKAADGLTVTAGTLGASRADREERLWSLIRGAGITVDGKGLEAGGALSLERPSGRRALHALVVPYRADGEWYGHRPAALVFVTDPEREACPDHEVLGAVFGLTPGESRVAAAMLKGRSIEQCAAELSISRHTARNHLKAIFSKTDTTRQGELVRLLSSSVTRLETGW